MNREHSPLARSILAILAGVVTLCMGLGASAFLWTASMRAFWNYRGGLGPGIAVSVGLVLTAFGAGGVGSGYLAGRIAGRACLFHAFMVPAVALFLVLRILHLRDPPVLAISLGCAFCALGGWWASRRVEREESSEDLSGQSVE